MKIVTINTDEISDWDSFHDLFSNKFGFPDFYGRNMDAWIDCMESLDSPEDGMTSIHVETGETLILELENVSSLSKRNKEIYDAIIECSAFVNYTKIDLGENPVLTLSFNKNST
jgi:RNAse (barnase) inhibitor barstar